MPNRRAASVTWWPCSVTRATASRLNDSSYCFLVCFSAFIIHLVWVVYSLNKVSGISRPLQVELQILLSLTLGFSCFNLRFAKKCCKQCCCDVQIIIFDVNDLKQLFIELTASLGVIETPFPTIGDDGKKSGVIPVVVPQLPLYLSEFSINSTDSLNLDKNGWGKLVRK